MRSMLTTIILWSVIVSVEVRIEIVWYQVAKGWGGVMCRKVVIGGVGVDCTRNLLVPRQ